MPKMIKVKSIEVDTRPDHDGQWIMVRGEGIRSGRVALHMRRSVAKQLACDLLELLEDMRIDNE